MSLHEAQVGRPFLDSLLHDLHGFRARHTRITGGLFQSQGVFFAAVLFALGFIFVGYRWYNYDPRRKHLPPKVPGLPILNNTLYHMQDDLATNAIRWTQDYGEIYRTRTGTSDWIWLNSGEAVKELIDRKSGVFSSRSLNPMGFEAASGGRRLVFMPYGKKWRTLRTIVHKLLTPNMAKSYAPIQEFEAKQLSVDLLDKPEGEMVHQDAIP